MKYLNLLFLLLFACSNNPVAPEADNVKDFGEFLTQTDYPDYLAFSSKSQDGFYIDRIITKKMLNYIGKTSHEIQYVRGLVILRRHKTGDLEFVLFEKGKAYYNNEEIHIVQPNMLIEFRVDFQGKILLNKEYKILYTSVWVHIDEDYVYEPPKIDKSMLGTIE